MSDESRRVAVVIPALDEEASIGGVVAAVRGRLDATVIVVDNGSRDGTAYVAAQSGAVVVRQRRRGYGWACRAGCDAASGSDVVVFMDGDGSMSAHDIPALLTPIADGTADIVCGVRRQQSGLMPWHQRTGNRVIGLLLRTLYGVPLHELAPFRAVRTSLLASLHLTGSRYAWPAQLLARAARAGARVAAVEVGYHARAGGRSKVGGSVRGSVTASWDIATTLLAERVR